jgi:hypothetical protein
MMPTTGKDFYKKYLDELEDRFISDKMRLNQLNINIYWNFSDNNMVNWNI